jgi:hypothetical protein
MYIRSQDDNMLIPTDGLVISISYDKSNQILLSSPHCIDPDCYYSVGKYKTKERCFDILNDIEKALQYEKCDTLQTTELPNYNTGIFTMPTE